MNPPIEPNLLLLLATLLKTKSVSITATTLGMSQPSASRALSRLRVALKDPLLIRSGVGMTRTRRGDELVDRLADWMAATSQLLTEEQFDPSDVKRRFRIASTDFGVQAVLIPALRHIRTEAPGIAIDIVPLSQATHRALGNGEIDLSISGLEHDPSQVHRQLLFEDRFDCVMHEDHPLSGAEGPIAMIDFLAHAHLGLTVSDAELDRVTVMLGAAARERRVAASLPYFSLAPEFLSAGDLLMTVPGRAAARFRSTHGLHVRPAPEQLGRLQYWILWHERSHRDPASEWLRGRLRDLCAGDVSDA